jgi:aryl-alcohol dehydrogenase-like predicted oxidoreductase
MSDNHDAWTSTVVYAGGLTFHPKKPKSHLKIPNIATAIRIAHVVLEKQNLRSSWTGALQSLVDDGEIKGTLRVYRAWIVQRDITDKELSGKNEASHRDSFCSSLLEHPSLAQHAEFQVIKVIYYSPLARQYLTPRIEKQRRWSCRSSPSGSQMAYRYRMEILPNPVPRCTSWR